MAAAFKRILTVLGQILLGILVVALSPLLLAIWLIPKSLYKPLVWLGVLLLGYRYVYPKRNPLPEFRAFYKHFPGWHVATVRIIHSTWTWLDNEANATFLVAMATVLGLFVTYLIRRADETRKFRERLDKRTPNLTVRFTLSEDQGWICTVVNVGAGTALAVKFRFYVVDDAARMASRSSGLSRRPREFLLLPDDPSHVLFLRTDRQFPFLLPNAKSPKTVPIGVIETTTSYEIRVELDYDDVLDREHTQYAGGGQSRDGEIMSVGKWYKTTTPRGQEPSVFTTLKAFVGFHLGRIIWRYEAVTVPIAESEWNSMTKKVSAYWSRFRKEDKPAAPSDVS